MLTNQPIISVWAENTPNKVIPTQAEIQQGVVYRSEIESDIVNGRENIAWNALQYAQQTGGLYNALIPYPIGSSCKICFLINNVKTFVTFFRTGSDSTAGIPPLDNAVVTTQNGIDIYSNGTTNANWIQDVDHETGYAFLSYPQASATAVTKGTVLRYQGIVYCCVADCPNPLTAFQNGTHTQFFVPSLTLKEAVSKINMPIQINSKAFDLIQGTPSLLTKVTATFTTGKAGYVALADGSTVPLDSDLHNYLESLDPYEASKFATKVDTTWKMNDYRGRFMRGQSTSIAIGQVQEDAIRNITGQVGGGIVMAADTVSGAFYKVRGGSNADPGNSYIPASVYFDVSRVVPTAVENRPVNFTGYPWVIFLLK